MKIHRDNQKKQLLMMLKQSIFVIERGWIDSLENRNADGYELFGCKLTEYEAKKFCESKGYWTDEDCWSVAYYPSEVPSD